MSARLLPSIDALRRRPACVALERAYGPMLLVEALREEATWLRERLLAPASSELGPPPGSTEEAAALIERRTGRRLAEVARGRLRPVINATGVIVHTNLGRAPLSQRALARVVEIASGYSTLEYDLDEGRRGARDVHAEPLLRLLTGAEAAVVVNNNAAATMLLLSALAAGREVVISRGELVEIGGGFRVPEILAQSGATLREVGTTNRTRLADYGAAVSERTGLILRVHPSNFRIEGFTERPSLAELVTLGRELGVPVAEDLGSGHLAEAAARGPSPTALADEPSPGASIRDGAHVVCFSGDKLLGGPQAGILVGAASFITRIRRHPLMRALRVDKMTYAALEATLLDIVTGDAASTVPVQRMLREPPEALAARAARLAAAIQAAGGDIAASVVPGASTVGGGSAPESALPTSLVRLTHRTLAPEHLERALRAGEPPVIARILDDAVVLDPRTVAAEQDEALVAAVTGVGRRTG
jgi:L-seryl-tRNA(Ser) seleniumtransferase